MMRGLFGKSGGLGGLGGGLGGLGGGLGGAGDPVSGLAGQVTGLLGSIGGGRGGSDSPGLFNGATTDEVLNSEPVRLELGTGRLGIAVLSGEDAGGDDSTISIDVLSFAGDSDDSAPAASLGFGPEDSTNLDVEILSGSYDTSGTGDIHIGPDIWSGGSPVALHLLRDFNDLFSNDIGIGENPAGPVSDGTLLDALFATVSDGGLLAA